MPDLTLVVNASPLIFLGNAGRLDLLRTLGARRIVVPAPVFDEVIGGGYADTAARAISEATWFEKCPSPAVPDSVLAWAVGKGESSVIATAHAEPGARVVIDVLNGRKWRSRMAFRWSARWAWSSRHTGKERCRIHGRYSWHYGTPGCGSRTR